MIISFLSLNLKTCVMHVFSFMNWVINFLGVFARNLGDNFRVDEENELKSKTPKVLDIF